MPIALTWIIDRYWGDALASPFFDQWVLTMNEFKTNNVSATINLSSNYTDVQENMMSSTHRLVYLWFGYVLTGIGFIGMFLPLLPTTIFWIGAAVCYAKSSPRLYKKLVEHKRFGKAIQDYLHHGIISYKGKCLALIGMAFSGALLWLAPLNHLLTLVGLISLTIAAMYVLTRPSNVLNS